MKRVLFTALGILAWMTSHLGSAQGTATADQRLRSDALSGLLGGRGIRKFGLKRPYWEATKSPKRDTGVHESTRRDEDRYLFRVSMLRNVAKTGPYFHDGSVVTLLEAVQVMADVQLGRRLDHPDAADLVAFLEALTGEVPDHFRNP